jgi:hypothetical protein
MSPHDGKESAHIRPLQQASFGHFLIAAARKDALLLALKRGTRASAKAVTSG